jgi:hypothetical protein
MRRDVKGHALVVELPRKCRTQPYWKFAIKVWSVGQRTVAMTPSESGGAVPDQRRQRIRRYQFHDCICFIRQLLRY